MKVVYIIKKLKLHLTFFTLLLLSISNVYAQHDSIVARKHFGTSFWYQGKPLQPKKLQDVVRSNDLAFKEMQRARLNSTVYQVLAFQGYSSVLIYPLSTLITGSKIRWEVFAIGGGLIISSIPFNRGYTRHARKAVNIYNNSLEPKAQSRINFNLGISANKVKVCLQF